MATAHHPRKLCAPCSALTFTMLRDGYTHPLTYTDTIKSGETCALCRLMICSTGKLSVNLDSYKMHNQYHSLASRLPELPAVSREERIISGLSPVVERLKPLAELHWGTNQYIGDLENNWEARKGNFNDGETLQITAPADSLYGAHGFMPLTDVELASSKRNYRLLRKWLSTSQEITVLPTRVIDIGDLKEHRFKPRLFISNKASGQYIALSHRWSKSIATKLKGENLSQYQKELPVNDMPPTVQDAIEVTRQLGLRYLWIEEEVKGPGPNFPTHVGMIIAYESDSTATRVLVKSMLGDNGIPYFWMPFDWILNFKATEGFWTLRVSNAMPPQREIIQTSTYTYTKCQSRAGVPSMGTPVVAANGSIACVSRGPGILDLFWRMDSGGVNRCYKYPETPWAWTCIPPDGSGLLAGGQGAVAAISPDPSVMYLFWIGGDGSVWYVKTEDGGLKIEAQTHSATGWAFESKVMISPPGTADSGGGLAVTKRASGNAYNPQDPGTVQVYWIGSERSVEVANNFIQASEWKVQPQIASPGSAAPSSSIAAAADLPYYRMGDGYQESVWWISPDNQLKAMLNASTGADSVWQDVSPDCVATKGSRLAAAHSVDSRNAFYVSPTGIVHSAKSYIGGSPAVDQPLSSTALVQAGSGISAVSTGTDVVVFWTDSYSGLSSGVMSSGSVTALSGPWLIGQGGTIGVATGVDGTQVAYIAPLGGCRCDSWPTHRYPDLNNGK